MRPGYWRLINFEAVEALPATLGKPRANATARALAHSEWLLRRKADGRYLAALSASGTLRPLAPEIHRDPLPLRALIASLPDTRTRSDDVLPLDALREALHELGIPDDYGQRHALDLVPEPRELAFAGFDRYRRPLWLTGGAARAWARLRQAAFADGIVLEAISGYRSHAYQLGIFRRKRTRGLTVPEILAVNAAPGYSEHHSGEALDIGTPGEPSAEESFENTPAFAWLTARAGEFGFVMSYSRGNPHGIVYEPWHWCWRTL